MFVRYIRKNHYNNTGDSAASCATTHATSTDTSNYYLLISSRRGHILDGRAARWTEAHDDEIDKNLSLTESSSVYVVFTKPDSADQYHHV
jgi:hypothetical protein